MGLDTEGRKPPECFAKFKMETFKVTKVRTTSVIYEFRGHIAYQPETSAAACPGPSASGGTVVQAEWAYPSRTAAEVGGHYEGGEFKSDTTYLSKCDDDPWLNPNIKCEQIGNYTPKSGWPKARPFTPPLLSQTQRTQLVKEVESLAVPEIKVPAQNQAIKGTSSVFQARVFLPTPSTAATQAKVTFEIVEDIWPSPTGPQPMKKTVTAPVNAHYALANVSLKHGRFRVRARISTPASQQWSKSVTFTLVP